MQITIKEDFFINGLKFQIHQAIAGVSMNQREITSILTEAKRYQERKIPVREINRRYFTQVTFLSRNSSDFLSQIQEEKLPSVQQLEQLIRILESL